MKKALVYTIDDNIDCLLQLVVSLKSVRRCCPEDLDVFILTDRPRPWMRDLYGAKIVDVRRMAEDYGLYGVDITWRDKPVPAMLLFRLLLPLVPELAEYDKVMYLDCDTEVWSGEFFDLFSMDDEHEVTAVQDSLSKSGSMRRLTSVHRRGGPGWKDDPGIYNNWDVLLSGAKRYVNSGVLVFNMPKLREGYEKRIRYILEKVNLLKPYYSDQDTLNAYFDVFVVSDRKYNAWALAVDGAVLRHYVGNERRKSAEYPKPAKSRPADLLDGVERDEGLGPLSGVVENVYVLVNGENPSNFEMLSEWFLKNGITKFTKIDVSPSGLYGRLLNVAPCDKGMHPEHMDNWMGHYRAIMDAIASGYNKVAVFEDTFRPEGLESALEHLSPDFDLALCTGSGRFVRTSAYRADSSKGYIIGRKCMIDMRRLFESLWDPSIPNQRLRYVHKWLDSSVLVKERVYIRRRIG